MPAAWSCPEHGTFWQSALAEFAEAHPKWMPSNRFACPPCRAAGGLGFVKPATAEQVELRRLRDLANEREAA